jgi:hypothetical protein
MDSWEANATEWGERARRLQVRHFHAGNPDDAEQWVKAGKHSIQHRHYAFRHIIVYFYDSMDALKLIENRSVGDTDTDEARSILSRACTLGSVQACRGHFYLGALHAAPDRLKKILY